MSLEFLRAIWQGDEATLTRELDRLVDSGLMQREGDGPSAIYAFKHALVQDVAYDSLLKSVRQAHHRAIAEALDERFRTLPSATPEVVAHHFSAAGMPEQAVPHWLLAGERALARSADREAIAHLSAGLELLTALPDAGARRAGADHAGAPRGAPDGDAGLRLGRGRGRLPQGAGPR